MSCSSWLSQCHLSPPFYSKVWKSKSFHLNLFPWCLEYNRHSINGFWMETQMNMFFCLSTEKAKTWGYNIHEKVCVPVLKLFFRETNSSMIACFGRGLARCVLHSCSGYIANLLIFLCALKLRIREFYWECDSLAVIIGQNLINIFMPQILKKTLDLSTPLR